MERTPVKRRAAFRHYLLKQGVHAMFNTPLSILSLLILMPLVPAYLLFKLLPSSDADVAGPLSGLNLKLKGAFGGYVAVMVFMTGVAVNAKMLKPPAPVWHVRGTIQLEEDDGSGDAEIKCKLLPPAKDYAVAIDRSFDFDVPMSDHAPIPHFFFTASGYIGEPVNLADPGRAGNYKSHMHDSTTVIFDEPIVLRRKGKPAPAATVAAGGPTS
jgi:hypothetical protein